MGRNNSNFENASSLRLSSVFATSVLNPCRITSSLVSKVVDTLIHRIIVNSIAKLYGDLRSLPANIRIKRSKRYWKNAIEQTGKSPLDYLVIWIRAVLFSSSLSDASTGSVCDRDQSEVPQVLNSRASFSSFSDATEALLFLHFMTRRASFSSLSDASTGSVCNLSYLSDLNWKSAPLLALPTGLVSNSKSTPKLLEADVVDGGIISGDQLIVHSK